MICVFTKKKLLEIEQRHGSVHFYSSKEIQKQVEIILEMMD